MQRTMWSRRGNTSWSGAVRSGDAAQRARLSLHSVASRASPRAAPPASSTSRSACTISGGIRRSLWAETSSSSSSLPRTRIAETFATSAGRNTKKESSSASDACASCATAVDAAGAGGAAAGSSITPCGSARCDASSSSKDESAASQRAEPMVLGHMAVEIEDGERWKLVAMSRPVHFSIRPPLLPASWQRPSRVWLCPCRACRACVPRAARRRLRAACTMRNAPR